MVHQQAVRMYTVSEGGREYMGQDLYLLSSYEKER